MVLPVIRIAFASLRRHRLSDPDGLDVAELADSVRREFPAVAGTFDTAEGQLVVGHGHSVDEDLTGVDLVNKALLL
jgi:hypothetical protein